MITSFRHSEDIDKHIIKTPLDHTASWINVVEPDREEIENLMEQYIYLKTLYVTLWTQKKVSVLNMTKILVTH